MTVIMSAFNALICPVNALTITESFKEIAELAVNGAFGASLLGGGGTPTLPPETLDDVRIDDVDEEVLEVVGGGGRLEVDDDDDEEVCFANSDSFATDVATASVGMRLAMTVTGCSACRGALLLFVAAAAVTETVTTCTAGGGADDPATIVVEEEEEEDPLTTRAGGADDDDDDENETIFCLTSDVDDVGAGADRVGRGRALTTLTAVVDVEEEEEEEDAPIGAACATEREVEEEDVAGPGATFECTDVVVVVDDDDDDDDTGAACTLAVEEIDDVAFDAE